ncbi:MAG: hypothetical protein ACE5OO_08880 [Candidatus Bathyarchaeia archaeon]
MRPPVDASHASRALRGEAVGASIPLRPAFETASTVLLLGGFDRRKHIAQSSRWIDVSERGLETVKT